MAPPPVSGVDPVSASSAINGKTTFDAALDNAQNGGMTPELEQIMIEKAITVAGPMLIMPRATDILNEAMSDD